MGYPYAPARFPASERLVGAWREGLRIMDGRAMQIRDDLRILRRYQRETAPSQSALQGVRDRLCRNLQVWRRECRNVAAAEREMRSLNINFRR